MNSKRLTLSQSYKKTNGGMWIVDFFYDIPENQGSLDEEIHRFYVPPYAFVAMEKMVRQRTPIGKIYGFIKKHSDQALPKPVPVDEQLTEPPKEEVSQGEFKFESFNFKTFCVERSWVSLLNSTEPYEHFDMNVHPMFETRAFTVLDKTDMEHTVMVNAKYGALNGDQFAQVYFNRLPEEELRDTNVTQNGIIFEFGTDLQQTTLNIFDRKTAIRIIATVYQIMSSFADAHTQTQWAIFGGSTNERSKMKMYDSIASELAQNLNLNKKIITGKEANETYYLLYR